MSLPAPLASPQALRDAFARGLGELLEGADLSGFILVCANATAEPELAARLGPGLEARFRVLAAEVRETLAEGRPFAVVDEDLMVFLKLMALGLERLAPTEQRTEGPWQLVFNLLRSLRPRRITDLVPEDIRAPFDPDRFNFNKPFMLRERLWSGELLGRPLDLYYNKYPFAPLHGLLVPEREAGHPQFLTPALTEYLWALGELLSGALPGFGIGYNSFGGYASVNHLHLQLFVDSAPLPVELDCWAHNGGDAAYPLEVLRCRSEADLRAALDALHAQGCPYNLLLRGSGVWVVPRAMQGTVEVPAWSVGLTWCELSGRIVTASRAAYSALSAGEIEAALAAVAPQD